MPASPDNSEIDLSEMESDNFNLVDVKSDDLLQGDTGLRSVMEIAQNLSSRGDALTHASMLNELFLMYSKDMVLQQSSNNQTIHDRLLSAILMAVSREYITMDQSIGQTKTFKMTPRGLTANLDKILSTEMFSERLSRMAESFYQSSRTTFVPRSKSKLQLVDQAGAEVSSPIRQQNVKLDRQNENDDTQEIAKNTNESARNKIGGIVFKEEKNVASDLQSSHKDNVPDANDTSMIPRVSVGTDSIVAEKIPLNNDSPMDDEEHLSTHARLMNNRKQRALRPVEQISIATGEVVRYYPSLRDAARAMDIRLSDLSLCCKGNSNKKCGNFHWRFSKDYIADADKMQVLPSLESLLEIRHASTKSAACSSSVALPLSEERDSTEDRQDSSAQRVEENNNNRNRNKNRNRQSTKDAKDPGPDLDLDSVTATTATDVRVETSSVREEPRPHVRAEHSAPSRAPEPITGQTYELLILAAMSKMSPNDHNCSWHPSDVTLRLIELFPQLMSSLEMSQQFRRILSLERLLSSTLRAASAGTLGCDYFSSEGVEGEYRYKLTTRGRDAIEFFSVFSPSYGASNSIPSSISAPVDMEARMTDAAAAPASMTTSSSSSSLHYDSDDIQYFDADIEEPNVGEKRKLSSRSSDDEPKRVQPSEKHGVSQEGADGSRPIQHGRSVEQRDPRTGQVIEQFISLRTASEATGVCRRKITDCCARGVNDTPYLWTYANVPSVPNRKSDVSSSTGSSARRLGKRLSFPPDYFSNSRPSDGTQSSWSTKGGRVEGARERLEEPQATGQVRCVKQLHPLTGALLHVYPSLKAAGKAMRVLWTQDISKCCLGLSKTASEFVWRYSARSMRETDNVGLPSVEKLLQLKNVLSNRSFADKREAQLQWSKVDGLYRFTGKAVGAEKSNEQEEEEEEEEEEDNDEEDEEDVEVEKRTAVGQGEEEQEVEWADTYTTSETNERDRNRKKDKNKKKEKEREAVVDVDERDDSESSSKEEEPQNNLSSRPAPRIRHCTLPKPVEQLELHCDTVLRRYESQKHATRIMKLTGGMIAKCFADPTLTAGNFRWRESKIPSSKTWNANSKSIRDLLRIRYGTDKLPRNPRSPVSKSKGATDASSSKATGSRTAPIIKIEIEGSCRSAGEGGVAGRDRDRDMALVASQSKAFTAPSGDCGDQRNGEISNQDDRGKDEMDIQASEADHLNLNDSQTATEVTWGEDLDDEQCDIQSDREMKEFWENRFNEQGARGKRLNEIRCAYEAMSAAGELKLAKSESDEGILEGEDMGEEMEEE